MVNMTIESIFTKSNMIHAAKRVQKKKSAGIDGISAKEAIKMVKDNYDVIYKALTLNCYNPNKVLLNEIPKPNGKKRPIAIATAIDRTIQGCLNNAIYPLFEEEMSPNSYGFIRSRNCMMAVNKLKTYYETDYRYAVKIDLSGCFNHISQDKILYKLRQVIDDPRIMRLINKYLKIVYITCAGEYKSFLGCPQGSPLSPLFANIVLTDLDREFERRGYAFVRYADDIVVAYKSEMAAGNGMRKIITLIERYGLEVNENKVEICNILRGFNFLGFHIYKNNGIHIVPAIGRERRLKDKIRNIINMNQNNMIHDLNQEIRGWINYYRDAEVRHKCRSLDLFINKEIWKAEKRTGHQINREKLINCHEYHKKISASKPE